MSIIDLPARLGLIGCGAVSRQYLPTLLASSGVRLTAVADVDPSLAEKTAAQASTEWTSDPNELLARDDVDIVLNLTPIKVHVEITRAALRAGKHVYSEKSLATSVAEADDLLAVAESAGLMVGCAPDTLLGTGFQASWRSLREETIGRPLTAVAMMFRGSLGPSVPRALQFFDMVPYYVSALVTLFGPARAVTAIGSGFSTASEPDDDLGLFGMIEFASGKVADIAVMWATDSGSGEVPVLDVYGTSGVLRFPNPNNFGDPGHVRSHRDPAEAWTEVDGSRQPTDWLGNLRGLGVVEMAYGLAAGRPPRAGGELARHVVDIIASLIESSTTGVPVETQTSCSPTPPLSDEDRIRFLT